MHLAAATTAVRSAAPSLWLRARRGCGRASKLVATLNRLDDRRHRAGAWIAQHAIGIGGEGRGNGEAEITGALRLSLNDIGDHRLRRGGRDRGSVETQVAGGP